MRTLIFIIGIAVLLSIGSTFGSHSVVQAQTIINGSFETGDYTGWTLFEGGAFTIPSFGTWGIATNGQTIVPGEATFDFFDGILVNQSSVGLPRTYTATDGNIVAYQLQNGAQTHRMSQDIVVCSNATDLTWDMEYQNFNNSFNTNNQVLSVEIRNLANVVLATLYTTDPAAPTIPANPLTIAPMTSFTADISAFAGQNVRLAVNMIVNITFFDAVFDNFRIPSCALIEVDIDIKPGSDPNSINPTNPGVIPVAILGSDTLDVFDIDPDSLAFGPAGAAHAHKKVHYEDVNDDGLTDLLSHYRTPETGIAFGDTEACLTGENFGGTPIEGCDSIRTVPPM